MECDEERVECGVNEQPLSSGAAFKLQVLLDGRLIDQQWSEGTNAWAVEVHGVLLTFWGRGKLVCSQIHK